MQPNSKFNLSEVLRLDPAARLQRYLQLTDKHKDSQSWKQISLHILAKQDKQNQYNILKQVLSRMKNSDRKLFARLAPKIDRQFKHCHTMGGVLVLVKYILSIDNKDCDYFAEAGYREGLRKFGLFERQIENLEGITFIDNENPIFAEIESAVQVIPRLYNKLKLSFEAGMIRPMILWLTLYRVKNYEYCVILDQFCKFIVIASANANKLLGGYDIEGTATLISQVLNKCLRNYPNCHNMCLIFENMSQLEVQTAVLRFDRLFNKFSSADMVKFSNVLTKSSLGAKTVRLFLSLSIVMKNSRMNDKLADYFKNFITPKILLWGKTSEAAEPEIKQLIDFYVNGLLDRTPNKEQCISNILTDFNRLGERSQEYWGNVMYKIAYNQPNLLIKIDRECKGIANRLKKQQIQKLEFSSWRILVNTNGSLGTATSSFLGSSAQQQTSSSFDYNRPQQNFSNQTPPMRPSYYQQQPPVSEKKISQPPKTQTNPYLSKTSGSHTFSSTQNNRQQHSISTPQQSKYGTFSSTTTEKFDARSPADRSRVVEDDSKISKTATRLLGQSGSLINSRIEPPIKKVKEPKVTPTKISLIPPRSAGYNTNYVDMAVMLLFALDKLPALLTDVKDQINQNPSKFSIISQLQHLFEKLASFEGKQLSIKNLMKLGPEQYCDKDKQFEICEYITKLFCLIVNDLERIAARYNSTEKFKQLFQIIIKQQGICPQCRTPTNQFLNTYFITALGHEPLKTQWQSQKSITCEKCKKKSQGVIFKNKIISTPTFTMVQLLNQNKKRESIPRKWNNSTLVGLVIVNSMSSISVGEFRFYVRNLKNPLTWSQFTPNYHQSLQFTNEEEDDEFESKFMPYIAVYQHDQQSQENQ